MMDKARLAKWSEDALCYLEARIMSRQGIEVSFNALSTHYLIIKELIELPDNPRHKPNRGANTTNMDIKTRVTDISN